jgi:hypothetical protein
MEKMTIHYTNPATSRLWARLSYRDHIALNALIEKLNNATRPLRCHELATEGQTAQKVRGLLGHLMEIKAVTREVIGTEEIQRVHRDGTPYTLTVEVVGFTLTTYTPTPAPRPATPRPARPYMSILQQIEKATNADDMRAVLERIENFAFCAEMSDSYAETLKEREQVATYRAAYAKRLLILGLA